MNDAIAYDGAFSIQYPESWVQQRLPPHAPLLVFYALQIPGSYLSVRVFDKSDSSMPSDFSLSNATSYLAQLLDTVGTDTTVISDRQTTLKDGTPVNESVLEYRYSGTARIKVVGVTAAKDNRWVVIVIGTPFGSYSEELMDILYSLEFHS